MALKGTFLKGGVNWSALLLITYYLKTASARWEKYTPTERYCRIPTCPQQDNLGHSGMNHISIQKGILTCTHFTNYSPFHMNLIFPKSQRLEFLFVLALV